MVVCTTLYCSGTSNHSLVWLCNKKGQEIESNVHCTQEVERFHGAALFDSDTTFCIKNLDSALNLTENEAFQQSVVEEGIMNKDILYGDVDKNNDKQAGRFLFLL